VSLTPQEEQDEMVNIALHSALFPAFVAWLHSRGLDISPPIPLGEEAFRVVTVPPDRWQRA
jgi:hypothetical protein